MRYRPSENLFRLPAELEDLKQLTRHVVEKECFPLEARFLAGDARTSDQGEVLTIGDHRYRHGALNADEWRRMERISKDAGLYNVDLPEEFGGLGLGVLGSFVVGEETNRSIVQLPIAKIPHALYEGTDLQRERYLEPLLNGEKRYSFALTEPDAGSDAGGIRTMAELRGDEWSITGTKTFISGADEADFFLVFAVTDSEKRQRGGITLFLVDADSEGISTAPLRVWLSPTPHQFTVTFDGVLVSNDNILGGVGNGFQLGQRWLAVHDRLSRGAVACGILSRSLDLVTDWAKTRTTFGAPLADRQAIQWMIVDVFSDLKAIRAASYECAARADAGEDIRTLAAMAKLMAGEMGHRSIDKVMQIFGGLGEVEDLPIVSWYRTLRHARIGGGTDEVQRMQIARDLLRDGSRPWLA